MVKNKICFFNTTKFWGGGEKLHFEYAIEFKNRSYEVFIVADSESELVKKATENNISVFEISVNSTSFFNISKINKLKRFFIENKIDTVFFSTSQDMKMASVSAKKAGVRKIIYLRGLAVPVKNTFINKKLLLNNVTHILVNSQATKQTINQNLKLSEIEKKTTVIYHGIDLELLDREKKEHNFIIEREHNEIIIGNAGRLTKQKGQHHFIEIAKYLLYKNINFKIIIAGDGELKNELSQKIKENNLSKNFILAGFVQNMTAFMNAIDIFALTSEWEGFGYVIVEAMACNKPVVAFDVSSNPEIISKNKTGFLVKDFNNKEFANKIEELVNNKKLLSEIGQNGRKSVEKRFELHNIIDEIIVFLQKE